MMISVLVGALRTVLKILEKRLKELVIRGRIETIQIRALLRSARILRRVLETWFVFCFFVQWNISLCGLFNAKAILVEEQQ